MESVDDHTEHVVYELFLKKEKHHVVDPIIHGHVQVRKGEIMRTVLKKTDVKSHVQIGDEIVTMMEFVIVMITVNVYTILVREIITDIKITDEMEMRVKTCQTVIINEETVIMMVFVMMMTTVRM